MWTPLALEYIKFLNRYGLETISMLTGKTHLGYEMAVYADGYDYLRLTATNEQFNKEEEQITDMLNTIEELTNLLLTIREEEETEDVGEEDYDEECEYDQIDCDDEEE